jgi:predicted ATP-grasp superfamily ATP-dependent carboligase
VTGAPGRAAAAVLVVTGASARAACFSAARAGFTPYWIDLFGDSDLRAAFPGEALAAVDYPAGITAALARAPAAPVLYTGALENQPGTLRQIAAARPLLGNDAETCAAVRNPARLAAALAAHGLHYPPVQLRGAASAGRWLVKPLRSGGGLGIARAVAGAMPARGHYLQEYIDGEPCAAVYVAAAERADLLGVTRQWVGDPDLHAPPFSYCGSVGPLAPAPPQAAQWRAIGECLAREFGLRGLFGVDAVVAGDRVIVVEVNPRYTASVEVLEAALGVQAVRLHAGVFGCAPGGAAAPAARVDAPCAGKAILFAPRDLAFRSGALDAWSPRIGEPQVEFADIPAPGTPVRSGAPILSVLCRAASTALCDAALRGAAAAVCRALL